VFPPRRSGFTTRAFEEAAAWVEHGQATPRTMLRTLLAEAMGERAKTG
jgi:hypothetical protein